MYAKPSEPRPIGGVIDDAIGLYRASFRRCAPIAILGALVSVAFEAFAATYAHQAGLSLTGLESLLQAYQQPPVMAFSLLQSVILLALFGALIVTVHAVAEGDARLRVGAAIALGFTRLVRCVIAAVLSTLLIVLGCLLIVPGIYLSSALCLWPVALYVENAGGLPSLEVSRRLIHGHWWHASSILGIALLIVLAVAVLAGILAGAIGLLGGADLGALQSLMQLIGDVADVLMLPMLPAALIALYNDLRLRQRAAPDAGR